jgi:hypothetical protein
VLVYESAHVYDAESINANAEATKAYCLRAGDRHLVVSSKHEKNFRKGLEKLGYILTV